MCIDIKGQYKGRLGGVNEQIRFLRFGTVTIAFAVKFYDEMKVYL